MIRERTNAKGLSPETQRLVALPRCLYCGLGMRLQSGRLHARCRDSIEEIVIDFKLHPNAYYNSVSSGWAKQCLRDLLIHYREVMETTK